MHNEKWRRAASFFCCHLYFTTGLFGGTMVLYKFALSKQQRKINYRRNGNNGTDKTQNNHKTQGRTARKKAPAQGGYERQLEHSSVWPCHSGGGHDLCARRQRVGVAAHERAVRRVWHQHLSAGPGAGISGYSGGYGPPGQAENGLWRTGDGVCLRCVSGVFQNGYDGPILCGRNESSARERQSPMGAAR